MIYKKNVLIVDDQMEFLGLMTDKHLKIKPHIIAISTKIPML